MVDSGIIPGLAACSRKGDSLMESLILQNVRNKHANQNPAHMDRVLSKTAEYHVHLPKWAWVNAVTDSEYTF
jgi:hypothetical protein